MLVIVLAAPIAPVVLEASYERFNLMIVIN